MPQLWNFSFAIRNCWQDCLPKTEKTCNIADSMQLAKVTSDFCSCCGPCIVIVGFNPLIYAPRNNVESQPYSSICSDHLELNSYAIPSPAWGDSALDLMLCNKKSLLGEICAAPPSGVASIRHLLWCGPIFELRRDFGGVNYNNIRDYLANADWTEVCANLQRVCNKYETFLSITFMKYLFLFVMSKGWLKTPRQP